ncbi:hypothetical protein ES705_18575 [subsurface metagenome]
MKSKVERVYPGRKIKDVRFYDVPTLVKLLGLTKTTIRKYLRMGRIPGAVRLGRRYFVSAKNINKYLHIE